MHENRVIQVAFYFERLFVQCRTFLKNCTLYSEMYVKWKLGMMETCL